jgi:hypothetical protein
VRLREYLEEDNVDWRTRSTGLMWSSSAVSEVGASMKIAFYSLTSTSKEKQ